MEWREDAPDWPDAGKKVELLSASGSVVSGVLEVDDFFPDGQGDEVPVWAVRSPVGEKSSLYDFDGWRFA